MPIEIRELIIKVEIQEGRQKPQDLNLVDLKRNILRECRKEIKLQIKKQKEK